MNRSGPGFRVQGALFICFCLMVAGCGGKPVTLPTSTPYLPAATPTFFPAPPAAPTATSPCTDSLIFLDDVTIPDYSVVSPGSALDKQWLVQNSGSCNWDGRYRLRLISGDALGAPPEIALYPARAGMQANIRILFTAPSDPGGYSSEWQAFDPNGVPFGESFAIRITVQY
jgi:hypothetical protein